MSIISVNGLEKSATASQRGANSLKRQIKRNTIMMLFMRDSFARTKDHQGNNHTTTLHGKLSFQALPPAHFKNMRRHA